MAQLLPSEKNGYVITLKFLFNVYVLGKTDDSVDYWELKCREDTMITLKFSTAVPNSVRHALFQYLSRNESRRMSLECYDLREAILKAYRDTF